MTVGRRILLSLMGTVRPISFFAWIPVVVGALLTGVWGWGVLWGSLGAILTVGYTNHFNNLIDRFQDRHNGAKKTLAVVRPLQAYWFALFLLPGIAVLLRQMQYNAVLLSLLFYSGYLYSYVFGRVPYLKRIVVAACVAGLSFLMAPYYPPMLWAWAVTLATYILLREGRKDAEDAAEDKKFRFALSFSVDWWCVGAPFVAIGIYLFSRELSGSTVGLDDGVLSVGLGVSVAAYVQIRTVYRWYTMRLIHKVSAGRHGLIVSLVGLMPTFTTTPLLLMVWINSITILYRSFMPRRFGYGSVAAVHDALLWASVPLIATAKSGGVKGETVMLSGVLAFGVFFRESYRLAHVRSMCSQASF